MLKRLKAANFSLLRSVELSFGPGLTVLTGESGAGKTLLFDAIVFALGGRSHRSQLTTGTTRCDVELTIELDERAAKQLDGGWRAGTNTLARRLHSSGRTRLTLNGGQTNLEEVQAAADRLFEITGQFESRTLFEPGAHTSLLDIFGGKKLGAQLAEYQALYRELTQLQSRLAAMRESEASRAQEIDFLQYQVKELEKAAIEPGEKEEVEGSLRLAENARALVESAALAAQLLAGMDEELGAYDLAARAQEQVAELCRLLDGSEAAGVDAEELARQLDSVLAVVDDVSAQCRTLAEDIQHDPREVERLRSRLDAIHGLERKYGVDAGRLAALLAEKQERLGLLTDDSQSPEVLERAVAAKLKEVQASGEKLTKLRKQAARELAEASGEFFKRLSFEQVELQIELAILPAPGPLGLDSAEILISLNPGEPARPLARVASGGEASRLLLGLKAALAGRMHHSVMLLDEVEAGLGGRAAESVAHVLKDLAKPRQVIAISHLPIVAVQADAHLLVDKQAAGGTTSVTLSPLKGAQREAELQRMVGGGGGKEEAALVKMLLKQAGQ